jgi:hypothetical protein
MLLWGMADSEERDHAPPSPLRRVWWLMGLYALLALLVVPVFPHLPSANEFSRWALTVALVEQGSPEVSPALALLGDRIPDLATVGGRIYSNKAPGASLAAIPAYALARLVVGPPNPENLRASVTAMRLAIATLPLLLLCLAFARQAQRAAVAPERIAFAVAVMLLGTPLFAYGLLLFSHAVTAAALFGAWLLLFGESRLRPSSRELLAGALLGLAAISEYPTVVPGAVLVACSLRRRGLVGALRVAAGALPLLAVLAVYNHAAFGSVLALSVAFERTAEFRTQRQVGLWGIGFPSPIIAARLLLDPRKGLLVFSPVLVSAFVAIPEAWRKLDRSAFWALVLVPLSLLVVYAGFRDWHGGWTVGARYLVPAMPFLAYLLVTGRPRAGDSYLLGASVLAVVLTSLVFPFVSEGYAFPWVSFATPLLAKGLVAPNLLHHLSRALAIVVPFLLVAAAVLVTVGSRRCLHALAGMTVWALVSILCVAQWYPEGDGSRWYVEKSYFERLDVFRNPPPPIHPWTLRQMQFDRLLPPSSWPF